MKERPILFSGPMVRAILEGRKTQTRRVVKPQPPYGCDYAMNGAMTAACCFQPGDGGTIKCWVPPKPTSRNHLLPCPYGAPMGRLWLRENCWVRPERTPKMMREGADTWEPYYYDADGLSEFDVEDFKRWGFKRRTSRFMPRLASRITLEIEAVRVERLRDISEEDAVAEGVDIGCPPHEADQPFPTMLFRRLWENINGPGSWDANPWVWVIQFRRVEK